MSLQDYNFTFNKDTKTWSDKYGAKYSEDKSILLYVPDITNFTIPNCVKIIGDFAFGDQVQAGGSSNGFHNLESVIIPDSIVSIGDCAFSLCEDLDNVVLPNSITSIGDEAFLLCFYMKNITLSNSLISIGKHAFASCQCLRKIIIPDSVISIGKGAFSGCPFLSEEVKEELKRRFGNEVL